MGRGKRQSTSAIGAAHSQPSSGPTLNVPGTINPYTRRISELFQHLPPELLPPGGNSTKSPRIPSQASSDFLIHAAQGDWAEALVMAGINDASLSFESHAYGQSGNLLVAGDPGFREFFIGHREELKAIGKRPDQLLYGRGCNLPNLIQASDPLVTSALAALEIRSSSYIVADYEKYLATQKPKGRSFLSFTVKREDMVLARRWIDHFGVRHFYVQDFCDRIYAISFEQVLDTLSHPDGKNKLFTIEKNARNQFKPTAHVNLICGQRVGDIVYPGGGSIPHGISERHEMSNGRVIHWTRVEGGTAVFDPDALSQVLGQ